MEVNQHGGSILDSGNLCKIFQQISEVKENPDLKLEEVPSLSVSYNITISWLYPLNGVWNIFLLRDKASQEYQHSLSSVHFLKT